MGGGGDPGERSVTGWVGVFSDGVPVYLLDINECSDAPCVSGASCVDLDGSVSCTCSSGYVGDGLASGSGCAGEI